MAKNLLFFLFIFMIMCGCAQQAPKATLVNKFDKEEAQKLLENGNSTITGSALLRQKGGGVVTCAGDEVRLIPVTPYTTERMIVNYGNPISGYIPIMQQRIIGFNNDNPDYYKYGSKDGICNAQGFFEFKNIKSGSYFVATRVIWQVGNSPQGGFLMKKVDIQPNETQDIVLTAN